MAIFAVLFLKSPIASYKSGRKYFKIRIIADPLYIDFFKSVVGWLRRTIIKTLLGASCNLQCSK